jgi:hypothetical protein
MSELEKATDAALERIFECLRVSDHQGDVEDCLRIWGPAFRKALAAERAGRREPTPRPLAEVFGPPPSDECWCGKPKGHPPPRDAEDLHGDPEDLCDGRPQQTGLPPRGEGR